MKTLKKLSAVFFIFLFSCNSEAPLMPNNEAYLGDLDGSATTPSLVQLPEKDLAFRIDKPSEIKKLIKNVADEKKDIKINSAGFTTLQDSKGEYKAITGEYELDDKFVTIVIPLIESEDLSVENERTTLLIDACTMKFTAASSCGSCKQIIEERCKSQTCYCETGDGGCSTQITFA